MQILNVIDLVPTVGIYRNTFYTDITHQYQKAEHLLIIFIFAYRLYICLKKGNILGINE